MSNEDCTLCAIVAGVGNERLENTVLLSCANFLVVPSIGPLADGHVMVISRRHFDRLGQMSSHGIAEYECLRDRAVSLLAGRELSLLEIEHGSTKSNAAGGCIVHAHVHWLPGLTEAVVPFSNHLPLLATLSRLDELKEVEPPYLMSRESGGPSKVYDASTAPPQFARRVVAETTSIEMWDWAVHPNRERIKVSIDLWRGLFADNERIRS